LILNNRRYNSQLHYIKTAFRIRNCWNQLHRLANGKRQGDFMGCHSPLCPICQYIKVTKELAIAHGVLDKMMANGAYQGVYYYHWVLTTEPCGTHQLIVTIQQLRQGVNRLLHMGKIARVLLGASVFLHVKLQDRYGLVKPHCHVLVAFKRSFKGRRYIGMYQLGLLWQEAMGVGYIPYVNAIPLPLQASGYPARRDFINLIAYSSRSIEMSNIQMFPEAYLKYTEQAFGLRKVRHVGLMADMRRAVKADYQERLAQAKAIAADGDYATDAVVPWS
jgi:hypothetical protein